MKVREEDLRRELEIALSGKDSQPRCATRLGIRLNKFKQLLRRARIHGVSAVLHSNMPKAYADSFKLDVVNSVLNESLTLGTAGARYNLDECTVNTWVRKYQEGGESLLLDDGRGRRGENELLKRENLLLKKAMPLVREKIRSRSRAGSGTSSSES